MLSCDTSLHVHMGATCENVQLSNYISMRAYLKPVILDLGLSLTPIQTRQNQNPRRLELRDRDERSAMWPLQDKHRCLSFTSLRLSPVVVSLQKSCSMLWPGVSTKVYRLRTQRCSLGQFCLSALRQP